MKIKNIYNKVCVVAVVAAGALLLSTSCKDEWNDHYDVSSVDNGTLWQAISNQGNISNFTRVVKACGYDAMLDGSQTFSVFAPTDDYFTSAQADSLIAVYQTQASSGVKPDDNSVVRQFLQNHISLYKHPVSSLSNDSITMMNGKYEILTQSAIGNCQLKTANSLYSNGVLFTIDRQIPYFPNVFEYLGLDTQLDSVYQFLNAFSQYEINESKSVPGGIVDGRTVYLDSVMDFHNTLFNTLGQINTEDSTYWMVAPTNDEWNRMVAEYEPYFNYDAAVNKRDSMQFVNSRLAIIGGTVFSRTQNPDVAFRDSAVSTSASSYAVRRILDLEPYYVYYKPFEAGGIFSGTEGITCSNGEVRKAASFGIDKHDTFLQTIKVEGEAVRYQDSVLNAVDPITVREVTTDNPFYDRVSGNSFVEIVPKTSSTNPEVFYKIPNVLSNVKYDIYAVFVPVLAYDTLAVEEAAKPVIFRTNLLYNDKNGKSQTKHFTKNLTTNPADIDTLLIVEAFEFPTCSYALQDPQVTVQLLVRVGTTQTATYSRTMRIDCLILKPHDDNAVEDESAKNNNITN